MIPEQPLIIERICVVQISSNLQIQTFLAFRRKWKSFYLNNHWIGLVTHSQHFFFLLFIIVREVALP